MCSPPAPPTPRSLTTDMLLQGQHKLAEVGLAN